MTKSSHMHDRPHVPLRKRIGSAVTHLILTISGLTVAMPFFWMLTNALKTKEEIWARRRSCCPPPRSGSTSPTRWPTVI